MAQFSFTEAQEMLRREARDFAQKELEPIAAQIDEVDEHPVAAGGSSTRPMTTASGKPRRT